MLQNGDGHVETEMATSNTAAPKRLGFGTREEKSYAICAIISSAGALSGTFIIYSKQEISMLSY